MCGLNYRVPHGAAVVFLLLLCALAVSLAAVFHIGGLHFNFSETAEIILVDKLIATFIIHWLQQTFWRVIGVQMIVAFYLEEVLLLCVQVALILCPMMGLSCHRCYWVHFPEIHIETVPELGLALLLWSQRTCWCPIYWVHVEIMSENKWNVASLFIPLVWTHHLSARPWYANIDLIPPCICSSTHSYFGVELWS